MDELNISFEDVFEQNKEKIFRLIYRFMSKSIDAEDLTQEVFIRAYKNYQNFRQESEIYSWLYRIAINLCKEKIRQKQRRKKKTGEIISIDSKIEDNEGKDMESKFADLSENGKPADALVKKEMREGVRKEIEKLPSKYSEVVILKELEDMSYEEISKILNISIDTIGVRLIRARNMLKGGLKKFL